MSTRHYCDACDTLLSSDNRLPKRVEVTNQFQAVTGPVDFEFGITYSSNATTRSSRLISGDGDLCMACFRIALLTYLADMPLTDIDDEVVEGDEEEEELEEETTDEAGEEAEDEELEIEEKEE